MNRWSFWPCFDVISQIYISNLLPELHYVSAMFPLKIDFYGFPISIEKIGGTRRTYRRTDGRIQRLMRPPRRGYVIDSVCVLSRFWLFCSVLLKNFHRRFLQGRTLELRSPNTRDRRCNLIMSCYSVHGSFCWGCQRRWRISSLKLITIIK